MNITTDIKQKEILGVPGPDKYTNRLLAGDVEANGLLEKVSKIWCIVSEDIESKEMFIFHDYPEYNDVVVIDEDDDLEYTIPTRTGTLAQGVEFWRLAANNGSKLIVHNCGGYDKILLERFYPDFKTPDDGWHDTFIQSKMAWFDRPTPKGARGPHGLQAYGCRLGVNKPDVKDWSEMNAFKLHRCISDVKIQGKTYEYLERERKLVLNKLDVDLLGAWDMENEYRKNVSQQELNGALVDQPHIDNCIIDLDLKIEVLTEKIEPNLPPTLKKHSVKISRSEMAMIFYGREVKDTYEMVKVDGEMVRKAVKQYYKPSTNFHRTIKTNSYTAFEISCGASPAFIKKRDLTGWIKENFPATPPKEWDIEKEIIEVKVLNKNTCDFFEVKEGDVDYIAGPHTRISFKSSVLTQSDVVKSFLVQLGWHDAEEWNNKKDSDGGFIKAEVDTIVRWPSYASPENQMVHKIKKGGLLVTSPKLTDDDYEKLPSGLGEDISHFNTYNHRRRFLENPDKPEEKGLRAHIRKNGRVPCGVNNFNTSSGRSSHSVWVNVAGDGSLYGKECRSTIIAPEGKILVSSDMKSAQLSIASFLANNKEYYKAVADGQEFIKNEEGEDVYVGESGHCVNARAFTLVTMEEWKKAIKTQDKDLIHSITLRRKGSKSGTFACLFGASGKKVATTLGIPEDLGNEKKNAFLKTLGLDNVIDILGRMVKKNSRSGGGYMEVPFGYFVWCNKKHKLLNYACQSVEAACQKWAENYFHKEITKLGLDDKCKKILTMHDEYLIESDIDCAEEVGKLMRKSYEEVSYAVWEWYSKHSKWFVGDDLPDFCFNLDGGYTTGNNYYECH